MRSSSSSASFSAGVGPVLVFLSVVSYLAGAAFFLGIFVSENGGAATAVMQRE